MAKSRKKNHSAETYQIRLISKNLIFYPISPLFGQVEKIFGKNGKVEKLKKMAKSRKVDLRISDF